jgi:hypothetical protein
VALASLLSARRGAFLARADQAANNSDAAQQSGPGQTKHATPLCDEQVPERFCEQLHVWSLQRAVGLPHETLAGTFTDPQVALAGVGAGRGVGVGTGARVVVGGGGSVVVVVVVGGAAATGGWSFAVGDPPPPPQEPSSRDRATAAERFMAALYRRRQTEQVFPFCEHALQREQSLQAVHLPVVLQAAACVSWWAPGTVKTRAKPTSVRYAIRRFTTTSKEGDPGVTCGNGI